MDVFTGDYGGIAHMRNLERQLPIWIPGSLLKYAQDQMAMIKSKNLAFCEKIFDNKCFLFRQSIFEKQISKMLFRLLRFRVFFSAYFFFVSNTHNRVNLYLKDKSPNMSFWCNTYQFLINISLKFPIGLLITFY